MIGFDKFFNFDNDKPLQDGIKGFEELEDKYKGMISAIEASNARLAGELKKVSDNAAALLQTVDKLNIVMGTNQKTLDNSAKSSEDLMKEYTSLKSVEDDNIKRLTTLNGELVKVTNAKTTLKNATKDETTTYNDLKSRLVEAEKAYKALGTGADQAVKKEQLEKVRGLAIQFRDVNGALADAKKGATVAAGSYNDLSKRVAESKKQLRDMQGGLAGNSQEFKNLKKFAAEGTEQLKQWDNEVGDNQRKVGDYKGELAELGPGFQSASRGIDVATKAAKTFLATPLGLTILAVAGALGALAAYFKSSQDAEDEFNEILTITGILFDNLVDVAEAVGKAIYNAIKNPKQIWEDFKALIEPVGDALVYAFDHPGEVIKEFGQLLLDNVVNRFKAIEVAGQGIAKILNGDFSDGFKTLGNAGIQAVTGVTEGIDKIGDLVGGAYDYMTEKAKGFYDSQRAQIEEGIKIAALEAKFRKETILDIIEDSETELQVAKNLAIAKDKVRFSDEERLKALREANSLLEEQVKGDVELAKLELEIALRKAALNENTFEDNLKIAELRAKVNETETAFFTQQKKLLSEESSLVAEIAKDKIANIKREEDARRALNSFILQDAIEKNQEILDDETSNLDDRLAAIAESDAARVKLLEISRDKELDVAKETAIARVELSSDTLEEIFRNESTSIDEKIALEREARIALIENDQAYQDQALKIQKDFNSKSNKLLEEGKKIAEDNVFKVLQRDAEIFSAQFNTSINKQLTELNEAFAAGDIKSIEEFEKRKLEIQEAAQAESIASQIAYLRQRASLLEEGGKERVDIEEKISQLELAASKASADGQLQGQKDLQEALKELKTAAYEGALQIIANLNEAEDLAREERLEKILEQQEREVEAAGDNEAAKSDIRNKYDAERKKIEQEQAAANRKRAIFEKAIAITEIAVNTARGVGQALGSYPPPVSFVLAAVVAALGAIQIATVASKPIPSFAEGTDDAPGGLVIINELGPEMIYDKKTGKGTVVNTDGPTYAVVPQHAKIFTAEETARIQENEAYMNEAGVLRNGVNTVIEVSKQDNNGQVVDVINRRMLSLESTVRSKKEVHINYTKEGAEAVLLAAANKTKFLNEYYS